MRPISKRISLLCALGAALAMSPASAAPLKFTFTGNGQTYVTTIDSNPTPDGFGVGASFSIFTTGTLNGVPVGSPLTSGFLASGHPLGAGFTYDGVNLFLSASQAYSGSEDHPVFAPGSFTGTLIGNPGVTGTLTISTPGAPGPELGGGLLASLAGLLALATTRLRRRAATPRLAA